MVTSASGKGRILGMGEWTDDDLIIDVERPTQAAALVVNDWFWTGAPAPTVIPWTWLSTPLDLRLDPPINSAQITGRDQAVATAYAIASQAAYGTFAATATLMTDLSQDAANYAAFVVAYYGNPLLRCPSWTFDLTGVQFAADENKWRILGRELGDRAVLGPSTITGPYGSSITLPVPPTLPYAARSLVIEGIEHDSGPTKRTVTWTTSTPLGGQAVGLDTFTRTVAPGGWGSPDVGPTWTAPTGAADVSVAGGYGVINHPALNATHTLRMPLYTAGGNEVITFNVPQVITGAGGQLTINLRLASELGANNGYLSRLVIDATPQITLDLRQVTAGNAATLLTATAIPHVPDHWYGLRVMAIGGDIRAKLWDLNGPEPGAWTLTTTNTAPPDDCVPVLNTFINASVTNTLPLPVYFDGFALTQSTFDGLAPGPWFRADYSPLDGINALAF